MRRDFLRQRQDLDEGRSLDGGRSLDDRILLAAADIADVDAAAAVAGVDGDGTRNIVLRFRMEEERCRRRPRGSGTSYRPDPEPASRSDKASLLDRRCLAAESAVACQSCQHQRRRRRRRHHLAVMATGNLLRKDHRDLLEGRETALARADSPLTRALGIVGLATDGAVVRRQSRMAPTHRKEGVDNHWPALRGKQLPLISATSRTRPQPRGMVD